MYDYAARSGLLGKNALEAYELQAYGKYGLFLAGEERCWFPVVPYWILHFWDTALGRRTNSIRHY